MIQLEAMCQQRERCDGDEQWHHAVIESSPVDAKRILDEILATAKTFAFTEHELFAVHLAVEEALVNAIKHGSRYHPLCRIHVGCSVGETELRVRITDEGDGFDPRGAPDPTTDENIASPSGRGLLLTRSFMTHVRHNERGNSVEMSLSRKEDVHQRLRANGTPERTSWTHERLGDH
jgi:serine/threonine-protein kinase RsbW